MTTSTTLKARLILCHYIKELWCYFEKIQESITLLCPAQLLVFNYQYQLVILNVVSGSIYNITSVITCII
jgi:hypothetical protein